MGIGLGSGLGFELSMIAVRSKSPKRARKRVTKAEVMLLYESR